METVADFILGGSKITANGDCSHEIKRRLLLGRNIMTNLDSILKNRDITLPTKVCLVKAMVFPVVMYGCENWTIKKAECWRIDSFELWSWRRLLRVPWTARKSNQSILKEISPEYSLEGLMLKLKLQYFGHLMQKTDSLEKTLKLGRTEGRRRRGQQRMRWMVSPTPRSLLRLMPIKSVMSSSHLILCHPLLLLPSTFPKSGSIPISQFLASGGQSIGASASASVLPMNIQDWSPSGWTGLISL